MSRPARTTRLIGGLVAGLSALLVAGCGQAGSGDDPPASLVPATAAVFAEATVDPAGEQETALRGLLAKFPGGAEAEPGAFVSDLIQTGLQQSGAPFDFAADVQPWLGEQAGGFLTSVSSDNPDGALVLSTNDADAAADGLQKVFPGGAERTYEGVEYRLGPPGTASELAVGLIDGFVVLGTEPGLKAAVDARDDASLADSEPYAQAFAALPEDGLLTLYADLQSLVEASLAQQGLAAGPQIGAIEQLGEQPPLAAVLSADAEGLVIDGPAVAPVGTQELPVPSPDLLGSLPASSLVAIGAPQVGESLNQVVSEAVAGSGIDAQTLGSIAQSQIGFDPLATISWIGDLAIFAGGTGLANADGAIVIDSIDPDASATTLEQLEQLARTKGKRDVRVSRLTIDGDTGFELRAEELPKPIVIAQRDSKVVIAYGDAAADRALAPEGTLADEAAYATAVESLGEGYAPSSYVAIRPLFETLRELLPSDSDPAATIAESYVEPLLDLISGARLEGEKQISRTRLNVE